MRYKNYIYLLYLYEIINLVGYIILISSISLRTQNLICICRLPWLYIWLYIYKSCLCICLNTLKSHRLWCVYKVLGLSFFRKYVLLKPCSAVVTIMQTFIYIIYLFALHFGCSFLYNCNTALSWIQGSNKK